MKKLITSLFIGILALSTGVGVASASEHSYGVDWSRYQGYYGKFGYTRDKFVITQIGGITKYGVYSQATYNTQVQSAIANNKRAHTYIWYQVGGSTAQAKKALDYFLPKVKTPKGSIIALDYEDGASSSKANNTSAILYGMKRIKSAGYTPMYYSYKPYTIANVNYQAINAKYPKSLWIASYMDYKVRSIPNFNYFPSLNGIAIWQFTSMYAVGGLDGSVDLTGITKNGYVKSTAKTSTSATKEATKAKQAKAIKVGDTVSIKLTTKHWANGVAIPDYNKGRSYKVTQIKGNNVLLKGVTTWISHRAVTIVDVKPKVDTKKYVTKAKTIKTKKTVYLYKSTKFTKANRAMKFKKGNYFKIKKITQAGKTTRLLTQSGYYVTGNKDYVKVYK